MGSVCSDVPELPEEVEAVVCDAADLAEGEMKQVDVAGHPVLLCRDQGHLKAYSSKCTHYGAPLASGHLEGGLIRCPWHGACFSAATGDIEDFPGLDSLATHQVEEVEGQVVVKADKRDLLRGRRAPAVLQVEVNEDEEGMVVIGGGAAGHTAVETLRKEGFRGPISLVCKEPHLPYDRPKLSKALGVKPEEITLRRAEWYQRAGVELVRGVEAVSLLPGKVGGEVVLSGGDRLPYSRLLIATGSVPRKLGVPGESLEGVETLRTVDQANMIKREAEKKHVVIVGTSFIGMEVAASLVTTAASVTVIGKDPLPFFASLGEQVGKFLMGMHRENKVQFCMGEQVAEFIGSEGRLTGVRLRSDRLLTADLAVVGVGVTPASGIANNVPGLDVDARGFIPVDSSMATSLPGVWAAGDVAAFPLQGFSEERVTIGHWGLAMYLGKTAALAMLGRQAEVNTVPFFWTVQFGKSLRYAGHGLGWEDVIYQEEEGKLLAFYTKGEEVIAVLTLGRDPLAARFANLRKAGGRLAKAEATAWADGS